MPWPGYLEGTKALESPQIVWQAARCFREPPWLRQHWPPPATASEGLLVWGSARSTSPLLPESGSVSTPHCVPLCYLMLAYLGLPSFFCFIVFEVSVNDSVSTCCPGGLDLLMTVPVDPHCLWFVSLSAWWSLITDLFSFVLTCGKTGDLCLHLLLPRAGAQLASCHGPQLLGETPLPAAPVLSAPPQLGIFHPAHLGLLCRI